MENVPEVELVTSRVPRDAAADGAQRAETLLAVAVHEGVCDLDRAVRLVNADPLWFEDGRPDAELIAGSLADASGDPARAAEDARRFLAELTRSRDAAGSPGAEAGGGTGGGTGSEGPWNGRASSRTVAGCLSPADSVTLARAALERGHRVRFRALGRSMRPAIPHGTRLEVEPRAFGAVRLGEVALYVLGEQLVAHRVVGRRGQVLLTRGDSCDRPDEVGADALLGIVAARAAGGSWRPISSGPGRWLGLAVGLAYQPLAAVVRAVIVRPLRASLGRTSRARALLRGALRALAGAFGFTERSAVALRRPLEEARAALLSSTEKDAERRRLYARSHVQAFTSLEENIEAGLTPIEELFFRFDPAPAGRALVLGCGPGRECFALAERGFEVTGVDREPGMLARARALARARGVELTLREGDVTELEVPGPPFDLVVIFSGLYDMVLPRAARVRLLERVRAHLVPGGRAWITFLSAYLPPGAPPPAPGRTLLEAINPDHERGDRYERNEAIHVFPHPGLLRAEARAAGLEVALLHRDQRAYDRESDRVRGLAVLRRPV